MSIWIKVPIMIGVPEMRLVLPMRSKMGIRFATDLVGTDTTDPLKVENVVLQLIEDCRPNLKGCQLYFMDICSHRMEYVFLIGHPDLPRKINMINWNLERLELCPVCKGPLSSDVYWGTTSPSEEFCSEKCLHNYEN